MSTTNPFRRLLDLLPQSPLQIGDVVAAQPDGTAIISLLAGSGQISARNPNSVGVGIRVFVRGGVIEGAAPELPVINIDI